MEALLWISIIVATLSLVGIIILLFAATSCMPNFTKKAPASARTASSSSSIAAKRPSKDTDSRHKRTGVTVQVTGLEEVCHSNRADNVEELTHKTNPTTTSTTTATTVAARSAPASVKSPESVPMHAVPKSVPASVTSVSSPKSIPSDWFNKSDDPSFSEFIQTTTPSEGKQ